MSKGLSEETKYELKLFGREINKDLTNLMDLLRKQNKDNKAILYAGRHIQKIILPVEEYQKMCQKLEQIDNANPSKALEAIKELRYIVLKFCEDNNKQDNYCIELCDTIKQALIKAQEQEKVLKIIKEKRINIDLFWNNFVDNGFGYHYYLEKWYKYQSTDKQKLTQEEFALLKRYLDNE